jgi:ubiquinone/menaquinone biosynthesis C-methylase UbiE
LQINQKEYFENAASKYDSAAVLVPGASFFRNYVIDKAMRDSLFPVLNSFQGIFVLEIGCGVGRWTQKMAASNSVIGVDISKSMLKLAKGRSCGNDCSFIVADASYLPFKDGTFDLVFSVTVLQHILDGKRHLKAISEVSRVSGSKILFVEEMWSTRETVLQDVYCPIRVVPAKVYFSGLLENHFLPERVSGLTLAPLAIEITAFLANRKITNKRNLTKGVKSSNILSTIVHFIMAISTISALFPLSDAHSPRFSMHSLILAKKENMNVKL